MLLEKGADVNAQNGCRSALYVASSGGHKEIVQMLLEKGADVNAQGGTDGNALDAASFGGHKEIVQRSDLDGSAGRRVGITPHLRAPRLRDFPLPISPNLQRQLSTTQRQTAKPAVPQIRSGSLLQVRHGGQSYAATQPAGNDKAQDALRACAHAYSGADCRQQQPYSSP
ncbi:hypothetical protein NEMBOFW57_006242 [Staphylotrichum longicolle]|uniref:Ankyrin repeat protein n=1 Tax=Staphylotrichum longicolle TaxID=669026 RepID=A0AAD4EZA3_9PEZI|nr:hypothetical protein NEMBOFW57_006242 [Staphylotrichum longicolle]